MLRNRQSTRSPPDQFSGVTTPSANIYVAAAMGPSGQFSGGMSWAEAMNSYVNAMSKGLYAQGSKGWFNRGNSRYQNGYDAWIALDAMPNPPTAALEEAGLAVKYGTGDVQFYGEAAWKRQIEVLKNIKNYRVCMRSSTDLEEGEIGLDNHKKPVTFHDVLWFAIGSYLLGKNEVNDNRLGNQQ